VPPNVADTEQLHKQYKDLALVEMAFRTMKQSFEEMQPIYVRKEKRTRGHVLVCMLSYMVMKYIQDQCKDLGSTQAAIYDNLNDIHFLQYTIEKNTIKKMPDALNETQTKIIRKLNIKFPKYL
jgi:transposase